MKAGAGAQPREAAASKAKIRVPRPDKPDTNSGCDSAPAPGRPAWSLRMLFVRASPLIAWCAIGGGGGTAVNGERARFCPGRVDGRATRSASLSRDRPRSWLEVSSGERGLVTVPTSSARTAHAFEALLWSKRLNLRRCFVEHHDARRASRVSSELAKGGADVVSETVLGRGVRVQT